MNQSPERKQIPLWRRAVSFCLALLMLLTLIPAGAVTAQALTAGDTLYLLPNSNWLQAGARFAAYFFNGSEDVKWVSMTDSDGDGYYECPIPEGGYTSVIFCRMNPGTTSNNFNDGTLWNQTNDLSIPTDSKNCYTVADGAWTKGDGSWSVYTPEPEETTAPAEVTYSLAGSMFNNWSSTMPMEGSGTTVSCTVTLEKGTYEFKIAGSDNAWYGNDGTIDNATTNAWQMSDSAGNCKLSAVGGDYTFTFNTQDKTLTVSFEANPDACGHSYTGEVTKEPTCTATGVRTYTCGICGDTYTEDIAMIDHSYSGGKCTVCGAADSGYSPDYYLVGNINGADYGCNDDYQNQGIYKFTDGKLVATFETDSYVFVKTGDNLNWYMTKSYVTDTTATLYNTSEGAAEKMFVPGGIEVTFTLVENSNGTLTLSYTTAATRTIYFDATLSALSYTGDSGAKSANGIPIAGKSVYYYATGTGVADKEGTMTLMQNEEYPNLYYVVLDARYDWITFANYDLDGLEDYSYYGESTSKQYVEPGTTNVCFYADSSDNVIYSSYKGNTRNGYWGKPFQIRSAEYMKNTDVVDFEEPGPFEIREDYIYINTTFYDYYSDYELNGDNRDDYNTVLNDDASFANYQNWYIFRHFNQALSSYYSTYSIKVPIYVGHFQPSWNDENFNPWGYQFDDIAATLNLYGYKDGLAYNSGGNKDQKYFMSVNNSNMDLTPSMGHVYSASQGIVSGSLSSDGSVLAADSTLELPFFNEDFLAGNNSLNTKLGEVFHNVAFPFTYEDINDDGIAYWIFDSSETVRTMKQNNGTNTTAFDYYLDRVTDAAALEKYQNLDAGSNPQKNADDTPAYGFFPFNSGSTAGDAGTYNYGFGASLSLTFNLTESGTVIDKHGNEKPIVFEFSGDDDLWIFIDGNLVLDIGGSHGKVSGTINFQDTTATVSSVKSSGASSTSGVNVTKDFTLNGEKTDDHTLTLYYMERGMWESNMRITFNFFPKEDMLPETTSMTVTKVWDVESDDDIASSVDFQLQQSTDGKTWRQAEYADGKTVDNITLIKGGSWTHTFENLPKYTDSTKKTAYSYRVVELKNDGTALNDGELYNKVIVTYGPVYGNSGTGYGQLITNSSPPAGLTITKALAEGSTGDWTEELFPIQVTLNGSYLPQGTELTITSGSKSREFITVGANGIIELYAGESVTISNVEAGTTYVVTELDTRTGSSYMSTYDVSTTSTATPTVNANQVSGTLTGQSSTTVTITNSERESEHIVVIDFGLSVDITVMEADLKALNGTVYQVGSADGVSLGFGAEPGSTFGTEVTGKHGTLTIEGDKVRYTPADNHMQMDSSDSFAYVIQYEEADGSYGYYYGKVTVVPAANIYYEDNFLTFANSSKAYTENGVSYGYWSEETSTDGITQDEDRPGEDADADAEDALNDIDADNVYGHDDAYAECSEYSLDAARWVTVDATTGSASAAPTATFTFTGTGFDVVSLTNSRSGAIMVEVWNEDDERVVSYIVNNYYGYKYNTTTGKWEIAENNDSSVLYQVPSIKVTDLDYGTYEVIIKAAYLNSMDDADIGYYTIWVDAIRTYNPAQQDTDNDGKYENTFESIYEQDGESNPHLTTVKKLILAASTFDNGNTSANGVVYVDGKSTGVTIEDYADEGPNNETYLKDGNGIAFKLRATTTKQPDISIQIGAKLAVGSSAELYCNGTKITTLKTATNMFYKLGTIKWTQNGSYWESEPIILICKNAGTSILSLTDIKVTGADAGYITADSDDAASGASLLAVVDEDVMETASLYMTVDEEPSEEPEQPTEEPEEPTEEPEQPTEEPEEPTEEPEQPTEEPEQPTEEPEDPEEDAEPGYGFFDWTRAMKRLIKLLFGRLYG